MAALDLAIVGGGINGVALARLAARHGLSVALIERADLGSGASGGSSHMLHGGLRYLEHGRFALVRESLRERAAVLDMAGPLARPQRFLVPLWRGARVGPFRLRAGLALYDWLAADRALEPHAWLRGRDAVALEPALAPRGLLAAGRYTDAVMDDARLAIAVARDAVRHGAAIHTWTELRGARPADGGAIELLARDRVADQERRLAAKVVVNATGAWCDTTRRLLAEALHPGTSAPAPLLRPSRGAHLVYPALTRDHGLLLLAGSDGRPFFAVPFGDRTLVGTTEVEVPSPPSPEHFRPSREEVAYLAREVARALPAARDLAPCAVFAAVRPLLGAVEGVGRASREHRIAEEPWGLSVAGGKYTTFRPIARDALGSVLRRLGRPGEAIADPVEPLPAPAPEGVTAAEAAAFAVEHEFARRLEDVMRRRTRLWMDPDGGRAALEPVAAAMAHALGWSEARTRDEVQAWEGARREEEALLASVREEP